MNTPDTELKSFIETYYGYRLSDHYLQEKLAELVTTLLTARDTYWKEREQALIRDFAGLDPAERHDKAIREFSPTTITSTTKEE